MEKRAIEANPPPGAGAGAVKKMRERSQWVAAIRNVENGGSQGCGAEIGWFHARTKPIGKRPSSSWHERVCDARVLVRGSTNKANRVGRPEGASRWLDGGGADCSGARTNPIAERVGSRAVC